MAEISWLQAPPKKWSGPKNPLRECISKRNFDTLSCLDFLFNFHRWSGKDRLIVDGLSIQNGSSFYFWHLDFWPLVLWEIIVYNFPVIFLLKSPIMAIFTP